jgi:hypothetical protein
VGEQKQVRLSGLKRRLDGAVPGLGHQISVIERADLGLEWTVDYQRRQYEERPLALLSEPEFETHSPVQPPIDEPQAEASCQAEAVRTPKRQTIAGFSAQAYQVGCPTEPDTQLTLWVADPDPQLSDALSQARVFADAYARWQGSEGPSTLPDAWLVSEFLAESLVDLLPEVRLAPQGLPLLAEGWGEPEHSGQIAPATILQVTSVSSEAVDPQVFELPEGFSKIDSLLAPLQ